MADSTAKKFQAPKGTRDFYPADLAVRRHIENVWRQVSINHGFDEIDGPTFEHLDLYTHKSGPGIASELFQVFSGKDPEQVAALKKDGGLAPYALRPEFTPTLARMVAAKAPELPRPIKWFAIPSHFRAESPQRGRLREFMQWNVDFIGDDSPRADAEVIATAISALRGFGMESGDAIVRISHRRTVSDLARLYLEIPEHALPEVLSFLDRRGRMTVDDVASEIRRLGITAHALSKFDEQMNWKMPLSHFMRASEQFAARDMSLPGWNDLVKVADAVFQFDSSLMSWCGVDFSIVRGLAYYTGTVFEIIAEGERAIAGGGRYDKLIESFGGPSLPACGFGMGDVVLANILRDKGLLKPAEEYLPRPDAFVIAANDDAAAHVPKIVADLRRGGLHVRQSYKTTRNVGKLLGDAGKCRARYAVILGKELADSPPSVVVKDMDGGTQDMIALAGDDPHAALIARLRGGNSPSL